MKKIILIVMLIVSLIGCRDPLHGGGIVTDKGIDYVDVKIMFENFDVKYCEKDKNVIEMYWIRLNTAEDKIYINLFSWEDTDLNEFIIIGPEHSDDRFITDF